MFRAPSTGPTGVECRTCPAYWRAWTRPCPRAGLVPCRRRRPGEPPASGDRGAVRRGCPGRGAGTDAAAGLPAGREVLRAAGRHLGMLAGRDLAARCAEGRLDAKGRAESRRVRKQALTAASSSRWAGAITRTSEDAWQLASRNLAAERATLKARVRKVEARARGPHRKEARPHSRVRHPCRAACQDAAPQGAEGPSRPRRAADRRRGSAGDTGRPAS